MTSPGQLRHLRTLVTKRETHGSAVPPPPPPRRRTTAGDNPVAESSDWANTPRNTPNLTARDRLLFTTASNLNSPPSSNVDIILASNQIPLPGSVDLPIPLHSAADQGRPIIPFNTHKFIKTLEADSGFHTGLAEGIMRATATLLSHRQERVESEVTSRQDLENVLQYLSRWTNPEFD